MRRVSQILISLIVLGFLSAFSLSLYASHGEGGCQDCIKTSSGAECQTNTSNDPLIVTYSDCTPIYRCQHFFVPYVGLVEVCFPDCTGNQCYLA